MKRFVKFVSFATALPSFRTRTVNSTLSFAITVKFVGGVMCKSAPSIVVSALAVLTGEGEVAVVTLARLFIVPVEALFGTLTLKRIVEVPPSAASKLFVQKSILVPMLVPQSQPSEDSIEATVYPAPRLLARLSLRFKSTASE